MKYFTSLTEALDKFVAPLVGAWIEIFILLVIGVANLVAPLVGAWIEILSIEAF